MEAVTDKPKFKIIESPMNNNLCIHNIDKSNCAYCSEAIKFGSDNFKGFCPDCGLPLGLDSKCKRNHKTHPPKGKRFSGKSESDNAFNDYQ